MAALERDNNWPFSTCPVDCLKEVVVAATARTTAVPTYVHRKVVTETVLERRLVDVLPLAKVVVKPN